MSTSTYPRPAVGRLVLWLFLAVVSAVGITIAVSTAAYANPNVGGGSEGSVGDASDGSAGCGACGSGPNSGWGQGDNVYQGVAGFNDGSRDNPNRADPKPLGTYRSRDYTGGSIADKNDKDYKDAGDPCRAPDNNDTHKVINGKDVWHLPSAVSWDQAVTWKSNVMTKTKLKNFDCKNAGDWQVSKRKCPVRVTWPTTSGPWGTGTNPDVFRSGTRVPLKYIPAGLTPTDDGSALTTPFGRAYLRGFTYAKDTANHNKGDKMTVEDRIDLLRACDDINLDWELPLPQPMTLDDVGNYTTSADVTGVRCHVSVQGKWFKDFGTSDGPKEDRVSGTVKFSKEAKWLGCEPPVVLDQAVEGKAVGCQVPGGQNPGPGNNWGWFGPVGFGAETDVAEPYRSQFNFAAAAQSCQPVVDVKCSAAGDVEGKVFQGGEPLGNRPTVSASGKLVEFRWPSPGEVTVTGNVPADPNVRDKKRRMRVVNNGAYPEVANGATSDDPFTLGPGASGATEGYELPWADARSWARFYKAGMVEGNLLDEDPELIPVKITATPEFTYDQLKPRYRFNAETGEVSGVDWERTPTVGFCDEASAEFFVVKARPSG